MRLRSTAGGCHFNPRHAVVTGTNLAWTLSLSLHYDNYTLYMVSAAILPHQKLGIKRENMSVILRLLLDVPSRIL